MIVLAGCLVIKFNIHSVVSILINDLYDSDVVEGCEEVLTLSLSPNTIVMTVSPTLALNATIDAHKNILAKKPAGYSGATHSSDASSLSTTHFPAVSTTSTSFFPQCSPKTANSRRQSHFP